MDIALADIVRADTGPEDIGLAGIDRAGTFPADIATDTGLDRESGSGKGIER